MHARRAFLFNNNQIWEKKQSPDFDVTMGSYDGAECDEIVGLFILISGQIWLYRDKGLGVLRHSGPEHSKSRKITKAIQQDRIENYCEYPYLWSRDLGPLAGYQKKRLQALQKK